MTLDPTYTSVKIGCQETSSENEGPEMKDAVGIK